MKKINNIQLFSDRYILINFENHIEPKVLDTLLIREEPYNSLSDVEFFKKAKISNEKDSIEWSADVFLGVNYIWEESEPLSNVFHNFFNVPDLEDAQDVVHDCYYDLFEKEPNEHTINKIINLVPEEIVNSAARWGWGDTEVRGEVYTWIEENKSTF